MRSNINISTVISNIKIAFHKLHELAFHLVSVGPFFIMIKVLGKAILLQILYYFNFIYYVFNIAVAVPKHIKESKLTGLYKISDTNI